MRISICDFCKKPFKCLVRMSYRYDKGLQKTLCCSKKCQNKLRITKVSLPCGQCNKLTTRVLQALKNSKSGKIFCSISCATKYRNTHKTTGNRRSKLEVYLEEQLRINYPNLDIIYNNKDTINSELDIYIPSLKLAIELNGIFHYEPIYGKDKLQQIQNNDNRKFQACLEQGIELCILDTTTMKYFGVEKADKFLNIITSIIDSKL